MTSTFLFALLGCVALVLTLGLITRTVTYYSNVSVQRTFSGEGIGAGQNPLLVGINTIASPVITLDACCMLALVGGAVTLDLTAIPDPNLGTVNGTGLTVFVLKLQNPVGNANPITITHGAANPYAGFGATFAVTLQPGEEQTILKTAVSAIGAGSKTLDITGTGTQALNIQIAMG